MRSRRACLTTLSILLLLALGVTGVWWLLDRSKIPSTSKVSSEISNFVQESDFTVKRLRDHDTSSGKVHVYQAEMKSGETVLFDVDEDGSVVGFLRLGRKANTVSLSQEEAASVAKAFAKQRYADPPLLDLTPDEAELVDAQEDKKYYLFQWIKKDMRSGALLPQSVQVQVNAQTGEIDGYAFIDEPVTVDTLPDTGRLSAERVALDVVREYIAAPSVEETKLIVTNFPLLDPNGKQTLIWQIDIIGGKPGEIDIIPEVLVLLDANTGEILQVEALR